jgi:hypothetical protein
MTRNEEVNLKLEYRFWLLLSLVNSPMRAGVRDTGDSDLQARKSIENKY